MTDRQTNGQTDRIILVAIPRLHYMQRGKNVKFLETGICRQSKVFSSVYIILRIHGTTTENAVSLVGISSRVAQSCYSVIGDKPFLWSKPKFDLP